jgi:hypothetical protein
MLHVSATQGHLHATDFQMSLLHCALGEIVLLKHFVVVIINSDVRRFSSYLLYCSRFCVPLGVLLSWLCVSSVALCTFVYKEHKATLGTHNQESGTPNGT